MPAISYDLDLLFILFRHCCSYLDLGATRGEKDDERKRVAMEMKIKGTGIKKEEENVKRLTLTDCPPFKPIHSLSGIYFGATVEILRREKIKINVAVKKSQTDNDDRDTSGHAFIILVQSNIPGLAKDFRIVYLFTLVKMRHIP